MLIFVLVGASGYSQSDLRFSQKLKLKQANKHINVNSDFSDLYALKPDFQSDFVKKSLVGSSSGSLYYQILNKYAELVIDSNFLEFRENVLSLTSKKDSIRLANLRNKVLELQKLIDQSNKRSKFRVKKLNKKYDKFIPRITSWGRDIDTIICRLKPEGCVDGSVEDSLRKQLAISNALLLIKDEYMSPGLLKESVDPIFEKIMQTMDSLIGNGPRVKIDFIAERKGLNGKDLQLTISAYYEKEEKFFDNGQYQSDVVDKVFKNVITKLQDEMDNTPFVKILIIGTADANPTGRSNIYKVKSEEWGTINERLEDGTLINLKPNQRISNRELAFLRAYNIKVLFLKSKCLPQYCDQTIKTLDYLVLDPNKVDERGTYRNVTVKIYFIDYFKTKYEVLFNTPGIGINDNLDQKIILSK
jgi:hypothetical protein